MQRRAKGTQNLAKLKPTFFGQAAKLLARRLATIKIRRGIKTGDLRRNEIRREVEVLRVRKMAARVVLVELTRVVLQRRRRLYEQKVICKEDAVTKVRMNKCLTYES